MKEGNTELNNIGIQAHWLKAVQFQVWSSLIAQLVKNPPAIQETPVRFPGREDLLGK